MRYLFAATLAAGLAVAAALPADAAQGCGRGFHRGPGGRCLPNGGPAGPLIVGRMYPGRGYWNGHRYYHNRRFERGAYRYY